LSSPISQRKAALSSPEHFRQVSLVFVVLGT
jgi:hypothetical protein